MNLRAIAVILEMLLYALMGFAVGSGIGILIAMAEV